MELALYRQDLVQTSTSTQGTLAVLPISDAKKNQKVAVGDLSGVLTVFSIKKGEVLIAFKTLPTPMKITSLTLGRGRTQRDKIFAAMGTQIRGMTRKGKDFFKFNTQLTETIRKVSVLDSNIWSAGEYVHNHFVEGKDNAFYLAPDRLNDAEVIPLISANDLTPVLACQDRHVRVLEGNHILYEVPTQAAPSCLEYVAASHDPQGRFPEAKEVLYGTESGMLVQLLLENSAARQGFTMPNAKKAGAIRAMYSGIDFTKTGSTDIVVGREDGLLEVYDVDELGQLQQVYSTKLSESVNSIKGGFITSVAAPEFIVQTFSGKVISYCQAGGGTLVPLANTALGASKRSAAVTEDAERRQGYMQQLTRLRAEIDGLKKEVEAERVRFLQKNGDTALLAVSAPFAVTDRCKLEPDEACYTLNIESAVPIFTVAIQCTIALQLLDVPANVAILSRSPADEANGNLTLATYRCQESTSRLSIKFKVREGKGASLQAFIIPQIAPKTCVSVKHAIKALCLHQRIPLADPSRPTNELLITGTFELSDVHAWIMLLLPDVPPSISSDTGVLYFQNTLLGTQLTCRYKPGEARFLSDLISTLGILHEAIMREATAAKHRVNVTFNPSASSLQHSIALVWPQLEKCRSLKKKFHLLEGLMELKMQDGDLSYLSQDYQQMLEQADAIKTEYKESPQHLDHLTALIKDLYLDFCKLTGISTPKQRMPMLEMLLADTRSTLDQVMDFMLGKL